MHLSLLTLLLAAALPHDDLDSKIRAVGERIAETPTNSALLRERAELFRLAENWERCYEDLDAAHRFDPENADLHLLAARVLADQGRQLEALESLRCCLAADPRLIPARILRARVLEQVGERDLAISEWDWVLTLQKLPAPDHFLERSRLIAAGGAHSLGAAIDSLNEAVARIGVSPALQLEAVELEKRCGRFDAAIERLNSLASFSVRQERWLLMRGEVQALAGRTSQALTSYREGLRAIDGLPLRLRNHNNTRAIELELQRRVRDLDNEGGEQ